MALASVTQQPKSHIELSKNPLLNRQSHESPAPRILKDQSMAQTQSSSCLLQMSKSLCSGLQHTVQIYNTFAHYYQTNRPADTQLILAAYSSLNELADNNAANIVQTIGSSRSESEKALTHIHQLPKKIRGLSEIQQTAQKIKHQISQNSQRAKQITAIEQQLSYTAEQLLNNPTERQLRFTIIQHQKIKNTLDQIRSEIRKDRKDSSHIRCDITNTINQARKLTDDQKSIRILSATLHLKTGWGQISALSQRFAHYCISQETPAASSLQLQSHLADQCHKALQTLVILSEMRKPAAQTAEIIQSILADPTRLQTQVYNRTLLISQLQRTLHMEKLLNAEYQKIEAGAAATVSYISSSSQENTLLLAENLAKNLQKATSQLYTGNATDNHHSFKAFLTSAQLLATYLNHDDLNKITSEALGRVPKVIDGTAGWYFCAAQGKKAEYGGSL